MLDAAGSERGVWWAIDACEALKLEVLGEREAACVQSCWRCSSERCALLLQKACLACSSCWKSAWVLSNMVEAMVRWRRADVLREKPISSSAQKCVCVRRCAAADGRA
jgi:hypothetical protein